MDHVPIPQNAKRPRERIQYCCQREYDRDEFLGYPERIGWSRDEVFHLPTWEHLDKEGYRTSAEAQAFLQQWLFFGDSFREYHLTLRLINVTGLLHTTFGNLVEFSDFIEIDETTQHQYVHTKHLISVARVYLDQAPSNVDLHRLDACLLEARDVYVIASTTDGISIDPDFFLSIALLIRFVNWLRQCVNNKSKSGPYLIPDLPVQGPSVRPEGELFPAFRNTFNKVGLLTLRMAQAGWCFHQIQRGHDKSLESRYYMSFMHRPDADKDHEACTSQQCLAYQVDKRAYTTAHTTHCTGCEFVSVDPGGPSLASILEDNRIPVVSLAETDSHNRHFSLQAISTGSDYVAISHVWSDGMGNPAENELPHCQIRAISRLVKSVCNEESTPFWMDTLCCPVRPKVAKKQAIAKMGQTYSQARKVLVLDNHLRSITSKGLCDFEKCFAIMNSGWLSRLWTFQEGALSPELYFQFSDEALHFDTLVNKLNKQAFSLEQGWYCITDVIQLYDNIRGMRSTLDEETSVRSSRVEQFSHALAGRSTSYKEDEALCLSAMMGLDTPRILAEPDPKNYMRAFWTCCDQVPRDLMFWRHNNRLRDPGFRWAPATFLGGLEDAFALTPEYQSTPLAIADRTANGLVFQASAMRLGNASGHSISSTFWILVDGKIQHVISRFPGLSGRTFSEPEFSGTTLADKCAEADAISMSSYSEVAIIFQNPVAAGGLPDDLACTLLYITHKDDKGVIHARRGDSGKIMSEVAQASCIGIFERHVLNEARSLNRNIQGDRNVGFIVDGVLHVTVGELIPPEQWWCVD